MKTKNLSILLAAAIFVPTLAGCKDSPMRWNYNKNEVANFKELVGTTGYDGANRTIAYTGNEYYFDKELTKDDVKVYNYTKMANDVQDGVISMKDGYIPYKTLCNYTVDVIDVESSYASFKVTYEDEGAYLYRALIHKDTNVKNVYLDVEGREATIGTHSDVDESFAEDYITAHADWEDIKPIINLIGGIFQIIVGAKSGTSVAVSGGIFTIITSLGDLFGWETDPTIGDVMNQLKEMDRKLDDIQSQINKNHEELMDMNLLIELGISQELLTTYENGISQFKADYAKPIDLKIKQFRYYTEDSFKALVKNEKNIDMYFAKNDLDQWEQQSVASTNHDGQTKLSVKIDEWKNAKAFLEKNDDIIADGFMDQVQMDIQEACKDVEPLEGMKKEDIALNALMHITDEMGQNRYANDKAEAIELASLAEQFAEEITTGNIVKYYFERLKMIYNFVGESRERLLDVYAGLCRQLDLYCGQAAEALKFAKENATELGNAWLNARKTIAAAYQSVAGADKNYCYTTSCYLKADYYRVKYDLNYTNPGNHPVFHANIDFAKCEKKDDLVKYTPEVLSDLDVLEEANYKRIINKLNLLKKNGYVDAKMDLVTYLVKTDVISEETRYCYDFLLNRKYITEADNRFASVITQRNMTNSDNNVQMTCVAAGNPDGDYFEVGWRGKFRGAKTAECWKGVMLQTTFFDGNTGNVMSNNKLCAYATYAESHALWIDDEYWAFTDTVAGNYFYMMTKVAPTTVE